MNKEHKAMTQYFRSAIAGALHLGIDFKNESFHILDPSILVDGQISTETSAKIFAEASKKNKGQKSQEKLNVVISAKTVKTNYKDFVKTQDEVDELTGVYFIPAILYKSGKLAFDDENNKLPWFPREYLQPMVEPKLSIGYVDEVDQFISSHVDQKEQIKTWSDYAAYLRDFYESVTKVGFEDNALPNMEDGDSPVELEQKVYLVLDPTVNTTRQIMDLYNELLQNKDPKPLYEQFMSIEPASLRPLVPNSVDNMRLHHGQMGGEYPLSPSQREAIHHMNLLQEGEILAVNGPPGTGKTTLLQSVVADMYVKRALATEKAPLIVATSTNNQAVTNIIASFGNIPKVGISNLEERWIEGVHSFATYFPSSTKVKEARDQGYQFTNSRGHHFVSDIEAQNNLENSVTKMLQSCNQYFGTHYTSLSDCQAKLHEELKFFDNRRNSLLNLYVEAGQFDLQGRAVDAYLAYLEKEIEQLTASIQAIGMRLEEWRECFRRIPFVLRWFSKRVRTEVRLWMNEDELDFLNENMKYKDIKEAYSLRYQDVNRKLADLKKLKDQVEQWITKYDNELAVLQQHGVILHDELAATYEMTSDRMNEILDRKIRYMEFWLAVHYYECRWASGEDALTAKQTGTTHKNVLEKFYSRLAMITPCLVMTFFVLPGQFAAYGEQKKSHLFNFIDLLIVDEAGQVSPEIAAGAFSLAKKAIVVGDVHQIEPVWSLNRALDKALAWSHGAIGSLDEYERLEQSGLTSFDSSVMKVATKSCNYEKYEQRGLFLSEHRRCYDEIIEYCNKLVYKGKLEPKRGKGSEKTGRALAHWPQMGHHQIGSTKSSKQGSSRYNRPEAARIVEWLIENFDQIQAAYPSEKENNLVGIITPFKAQVSCIRAEMRRRAPELLFKVSVGTVHTFQGAERNLIILSTVYGSGDGCYFMDANKSLMNVAVSRAKDHFFAFGDLGCLSTSVSTASGLLRKNVVGNVI
ncbi:DNA helicase [Paenibacillus sp. CAA11]|uniref:AAA domain-containing protein n=1 Tax=Paenibacillus sp. CAA11 TaxID=1532905 RepID=UPI000D3C62DD|nr:AAA domain-containing protein [Paenibacillus sp. CAA11]AWB46067.1 DNA helicase [Paenibacillus sp. CAA11]